MEIGHIDVQLPGGFAEIEQAGKGYLQVRVYQHQHKDVDRLVSMTNIFADGHVHKIGVGVLDKNKTEGVR